MTVLILALVSFATGALLAALTSHSPLPVGLVGAVLMVGASLAARRRWKLPQADAPGSPERALWIGLGTSAAVLGHMLVSLWLLGPDLDLHTRSGHALGVDSWTLVLGGAIAWWVVRDRDPRRDERDAAIDALGLRWQYASLLALLLPSIYILGFIEPSRSAMSRPLIAHLVIAAVIASVVIGQALRLHIYRRDSRPA